jgi:hypothetical protein
LPPRRQIGDPITVPPRPRWPANRPPLPETPDLGGRRTDLRCRSWTSVPGCPVRWPSTPFTLTRLPVPSHKRRPNSRLPGSWGACSTSVRYFSPFPSGCPSGSGSKRCGFSPRPGSLRLVSQTRHRLRPDPEVGGVRLGFPAPVGVRSHVSPSTEVSGDPCPATHAPFPILRLAALARVRRSGAANDSTPRPSTCSVFISAVV